MRSQKHNQGELKELKIQGEKLVIECFELMAKNTGISVDELVIIAMKRFQSAHIDYQKLSPNVD